MSLFEPFPKLARLSRECTITEKIDGTNAQVYIEQLPLKDSFDECGPCQVISVNLQSDEYFKLAGDILHGELFKVYAGSRTRIIKPGKTTDNYGFAQWVFDNADELVKLGPGRHFGEWWGKGIQRGYGLNERRFSLFHTRGIQSLPACVSVVPTLYAGLFDTQLIDRTMSNLRITGSPASEGFMDPEGIVVWHSAARVAFKKTFEKDEHGKEAA